MNHSIRHRNGLPPSPPPQSASPRKNKRLISPRVSPTANNNNNPYSSANGSTATAPSSAYYWSSRVSRTLCVCGILSVATLLITTVPSQRPNHLTLEPATIVYNNAALAPKNHRLRPKQQQQPYHNNRIVYLEQDNDFTFPIVYRSVDSISSHTTIQDDWQSPHKDECLPKADWQTTSNPNCNTIHEISLYENDRLQVLGEGWFRTTWRYDDDSIPVVLKTLRIAREYLAEYYELHRRDAVAMERLTASPFVVNIYGYCGQSAINELADFPYAGIQNLEGFNKRMRGNDSPKANVIKLRMAASIALGLADIHAGGTVNQNDAEDGTGVYMAHYDLNPRNIALFAGGKPKINDFNIAEFIHYDNTTDEDCKFPSRLHEPWWRAPEEMNTTHTILVNEKVDIYALGNILYHTLTTHSSRGSQKAERMPEVRPIVAAGIRPVIPRQYTHSKDPNIVAIVQAIDVCWEKDPDKRASAAEVADILYDAIVKSQMSSHGALPSDAPVAVNNATTAHDDEMPSGEEDKDAVAHWDAP